MTPAPLTVRDARTTTRRASRTFSLACRMLGADVRDDVRLLYLVFRRLDDAVDLGLDGAEARVAAVEAWAAGRPGAVTEEVAVLRDLSARHPLSREAFAAFCAGMRADLEGARPATEADVDRYCHQVAGTVGIVMADLLGSREPARARAYANALGMAMQRTNILRDIDEDRASGRVYLAAETVLRCGGLEPGRRAALLRDQIARADRLYDEGCAGIGLLLRGRTAVAAAAGMYREILRQIEREGYGERPGRAVVSGPRKLVAAARGQLHRAPSGQLASPLGQRR